MSRHVLGLVALAGFVSCARSVPVSKAEPSGDVSSVLCRGCHRNIWETYKLTGMARSFYRPKPENTIEDYAKKNTFYHKASASYFTMLARDGKYFQRR